MKHVTQPRGQGQPQPEGNPLDMGPDGYEGYSGGVNMAAKNPRELQPNQLAGMVNCSIRGGWLTPRDGYSWLPLIWSNANASVRFQTGLAQGAAYYQRGTDPRILWAVGGEVFSFNPVTRRIYTITPRNLAVPFDPSARFVYMQERAGSVAVQDGTNCPIVITGSTARLCQPKKGDMFGGRLMADGWGRLLLVSKDGTKIYFSNHEADPTSRPFDFTEGNDYYLNAPYFVIPARCGKIVAVGFVDYVDTASGLGPCIAFGTRGTMTYDVSQARTTWITGNIARMTLPTIGACANRCVVGSTAALYFRDQHGRIRNLQTAIASLKSITVQRFDREVSTILDREDKSLRAWHGGAEHNDRTLFTALPMTVTLPRGRDVCHQALLSWNTDVLSGNVVKLPACWEGIHTGVRPQLVTSGQFGGDDFTGGETRLFMLAMDSDMQRRVYEQVPGQRFDIAPAATGNHAPTRKSIEWSFTTKWFDWGHSAVFKRLTGGFANIGDIRGPLKIEALWRTGDGQNFQPWFTHYEGREDALRFGQTGCDACTVAEASPGGLDRWPFPAMPDNVAALDCGDARRFCRIQFIFRVTGWCEFRELEFFAMMIEKGSKAAPVCSPPASLKRSEQCAFDLLTYDALKAPPTYG